MELGGQIRKYRDALGLSQEELAEKIFVTRQSVSNWENGKTYPDLQSLLRLSELFSLSLDELIKGDIETMKEEINKAEIEKMNRWGGLLTLLMLAVVILPVPLLKLLDTVGFLLVMGPLFVVAMAVALKVEKIKKDNDVHTYKEIVAFSEGRRLDELDKAVEKGKRPYQALVAALSAALIALLAAGAISLMYLAFDYLTKG
ncbi:MAG: helix-turn-helix domain-containing protein [Oscillospiraceae bacterium]|nr:helix-turn-helix domain-containing protein [Oscillospiraceae bacterium]MBP3319377.1 helix-turn-helix domain-containing protein [Ruminiclostridium sp.]MBP3520716.1 helix-turn-helix domain-containing protein [Oscillospiraceae bacterium]